MAKTKWIVVTGLDGSGKTSLVSNLTSWLVEEKGLNVKRDRFPHDRYLVKDLLNKSKDRYTDRLLFALDNRLFGTELAEIIESGKYDFIVKCQFLIGNVNNCIYQLFFFIILPLLFKINYFPQKSTSTYFISESL